MSAINNNLDIEMENESDDECLFELDVYINGDKQIEEDLFVFQYPMRKKDRPYGDAGNQLLKIERSIPPKKDQNQINENLKGMEELTGANNDQISNFRLTYELNQGNDKNGTVSNYD